MVGAVVTRPQAKYEVVAESLRKRVAGLKPDDPLPTEREMQQEFDVSRATVRRALEVLLREGLIYNVQGSGTYVADPAIVSKTLRLTGFSQDMRLRGMVPSSVVLSHAVESAAPAIADRLRVGVQDQVVSIRRLRLADGAPMALEEVYFLRSMVAGLELDASRSLYEQLDANGVRVDRAHEVIDVVNLDAVQARSLDQAVGAAALRVRRVTYTERGQALEYGETVYRGDRYNFEIVIGADL